MRDVSYRIISYDPQEIGLMRITQKAVAEFLRATKYDSPNATGRYWPPAKSKSEMSLILSMNLLLLTGVGKNIHR